MEWGRGHMHLIPLKTHTCSIFFAEMLHFF
jgi:hypothetical protein